MSEASIDVAKLIDDSRIGRTQIGVFLLCGFIALLDGLDTQSIGVAAPAMAAALGIPISSFGPVFAIALVGATLGALGFGPLADRYGRKPMLIIATTIFGAFSLLTALCTTLETLMACRLLAGFGMGGATPCFIALTSEYAPRRHRAAIVSAMWAAFPFGCTVGALLTSLLIDRHGWQVIFYIGGIAPLLSVALLALWLPESVRYLLRRPDDGHTAVREIIRRLYGPATPGVGFVADEEAAGGATLRHLFTGPLAARTVLLWGAFATSFATLIVTTLWTPALLQTYGLSHASGAVVAGVLNLGCTVGMAFAGRLMERFGLASTLSPALVIGGIVLAVMGQVGQTVVLACLFASLVGFFVGFGAAGMIALSSILYPTEIRSTGIGWAMGIGRAGQAIAPVLTGALLAAGMPVSNIFLTVAAMPVVAALFVLLLSAAGRHHAAVSNRSSAPG